MKLTIVRGLPGSGKTTKAYEIISKYNRAVEVVAHLEADLFHMIKSQYVYKPELASYAHMFCEGTTAYYLNKGHNVVVSNTFVTKSSIIPYYDLAELMGAEFEIITCDGQYESVHNIPKDVMARMVEFFEKFDTEEFLEFYYKIEGQSDFGIVS
jgi:predicted kinase